MPYALVMYFDKKSEESLRKIWVDISESGITSSMMDSGIRPHITLSVFSKLECLPCEQELAAFARKTRLIGLQASFFSFFVNPYPVVFIAPTPTRALMAFHQNIINSLVADLEVTNPMYLPGSWIPHCTLALDFEKDLYRKSSVCA